MLQVTKEYTHIQTSETQFHNKLINDPEDALAKGIRKV